MSHHHDIDRPCSACSDYGLRPGNTPDAIAKPCDECPRGERIQRRLAASLTAHTSRIPRDHDEPAAERTPHTNPPAAGTSHTEAAA